MTFVLKNIIFDFFGIRDKSEDLYKDVNGKGLHQRFNEMLAEDVDENEIDKTENVVKYTVDPDQCLDKFFFYREQEYGGLYSISAVPAIRRKIIKYASYLNRIKGTEESYIFSLLLLGFSTVNIYEYVNTSGFDSPTTFDDEVRRFDMKCNSCGRYRIDITGSITMTNSLLNSIMNVVRYNEPINATLDGITYNGDTISIVGDFSDDFSDDFFND